MKKALKIICDVLTFGIPLLIRALYARKRNAIVRKINDVGVVTLINYLDLDGKVIDRKVQIDICNTVSVPLKVDEVDELAYWPESEVTNDK